MKKNKRKKIMDGAVSNKCAWNLKEKNIINISNDPNMYYRFRYQKLEIEGNTTKVYLEDEMGEITASTDNVVIESLPTNITVGTILIPFKF